MRCDGNVNLLVNKVMATQQEGAGQVGGLPASSSASSSSSTESRTGTTPAQLPDPTSRAVPRAVLMTSAEGRSTRIRLGSRPLEGNPETVSPRGKTAIIEGGGGGRAGFKGGVEGGKGVGIDGDGDEYIEELEDEVLKRVEMELRMADIGGSDHEGEEAKGQDEEEDEDRRSRDEWEKEEMKMEQELMAQIEEWREEKVKEMWVNHFGEWREIVSTMRQVGARAKTLVQDFDGGNDKEVQMDSTSDRETKMSDSPRLDMKGKT